MGGGETGVKGTAFNHEENKAMGQHSITRKTKLRDSIQSWGKQSYGTAFGHEENKAMGSTAFNHEENKATGQHSITRKTKLWDSIQSRGKQSYGTAFNHEENKAMGQHSIMRKTELSSQKGKLKSFRTRKQYCLIQKTCKMLSFLTGPLKHDKTTENNCMHHVYGCSMTKGSSDITMKTTNINSNNTKQVFNITNNSRSILVGLRSQLTHSLGSSISPYCLLICFKCCFVRQLNGFGLNISYRPSNTPPPPPHTHTLTPIQNIQRKE